MAHPEPLPIAIVGLNFGRHICEEIAHGAGSGHFRLAAVCDMDAAKARELGGRYGAEVFTDLDALLARTDLPIIGLFTGPNGRARLLSRILSAGKDVMTTKPFERESAAAQAVLAQAVAQGRALWLNSPSQGLPPDLAAIKEMERKHDLGRPVAARAEVWVRYHEKADGSWYDDPAQCPVAPVYRLGIYLINDLVRLLGAVESVQVLGSRLSTGRPTLDQGLLAIRFRSGALASVFASFCVRDGDHYRNSMTVNYENGTVYRNVGPDRAKPGPGAHGCQVGVVVGDGDGRRMVAESLWCAEGSGGYDWAGFARAVRERIPPDADTVRTVVEGIRVIEAMAESERTGLPARLPAA